MPLETRKSCLQRLCLWRAGAGHCWLRTPKTPIAAGPDPPHPPLPTSGTIRQGLRTAAAGCNLPFPPLGPTHGTGPAPLPNLSWKPLVASQSSAVKHSVLHLSLGHCMGRQPLSLQLSVAVLLIVAVLKC
jgi:hypothetical protein